MKNENSLIKPIEQSYFFAFNDIRFYDFTIDLANPFYQVMHNMCIDMVAAKFGSQKIAILDIGAGTGAESLRILKNNPNAKIVAVDISPPMKVKFISKAKKHFSIKTIKENIHYEVADFLALTNYDLLKLNDNKKFDLIISAYTIHHFITSDKKIIYERVYDLMADNGIFINIDLFNYIDDELSIQAHNSEIEWIKDKFENPGLISKEASDIPLKKRRQLRDKWINHYENDNLLDTYELQKDFLLTKGASAVEMPFRSYQNGLLWAKK